jgi:hypothetical protein
MKGVKGIVKTFAHCSVVVQVVDSRVQTGILNLLSDVVPGEIKEGVMFDLWEQTKKQ